MTEQEDIWLYYILKEGNLKPLSYFVHVSLYLPDFDAFVWRLPLRTQANFQACFRWMSKCVIKRGQTKENLELNHMKNNVVMVKTCSSVFNYATSMSSRDCFESMF